jgi:hypothetical protein
VTRVLEDAGETIHPLSRALASESAHWEGASGEHELHAFQALREMDEIFLANFMVFLASSVTAPTTCGWVTRPGRWTTSCTRTPSSRRHGSCS